MPCPSPVDTYIEEIVQQATIDLFSHYAVEIGPNSDLCAILPNVALCGVIGFTGPDIRGSLMLACSSEPLKLVGGEGLTTMRDWLAELTNQLLGRVKNRLVAMGVDFYASTPVVLGGGRIAPINSQPLGHLFTADGGVVSVWFDTELRAGLELVPTTNAVLREGSTLLF
ncbi:MAG: chemotaxis protein CheX [Kofleriaceae bacterium]